MAGDKAVKKTNVKKTGPKKPMSAFFFYLGDRRPKMLEEKPELKKAAKEIAKLAGEEWRNMSESDKKPWTDKASAAKTKYEKEVVEAATAAE